MSRAIPIVQITAKYLKQEKYKYNVSKVTNLRKYEYKIFKYYFMTTIIDFT